jgi:hypothetical protein
VGQRGAGGTQLTTRRLLALTVVLLVLGAAIPLALANCGGGSAGITTVTTGG